MLYDQMNDTEPDSESNRGEDRPNESGKHRPADIEHETGSTWSESEKLAATGEATIKDELKLEGTNCVQQQQQEEKQGELTAAAKLKNDGAEDEIRYTNGLHSTSDKEKTVDVGDESRTSSALVDTKGMSATHDEDSTMAVREAENNQKTAGHCEGEGGENVGQEEGHGLHKSEDDSLITKRDEETNGAEQQEKDSTIGSRSSSADQALPPKAKAAELNGRRYDADDDSERAEGGDSSSTAVNHAESGDGELLQVASTSSDAK